MKELNALKKLPENFLTRLDIEGKRLIDQMLDSLLRQRHVDKEHFIHLELLVSMIGILGCRVHHVNEMTNPALAYISYAPFRCTDLPTCSPMYLLM